MKNARKNIAINSKVVYVNGIFVGGFSIDDIMLLLKNGELPLRLTLVHPAGLKRHEKPTSAPDIQADLNYSSTASR